MTPSTCAAACVRTEESFAPSAFQTVMDSSTEPVTSRDESSHASARIASSCARVEMVERAMAALLISRSIV